MEINYLDEKQRVCFVYLWLGQLFAQSNGRPGEPTRRCT